MKTCTLCQQDKDENQFSFRNKSKNRRSSWCKECYSGKNKKHYKNNKDDYFANARKWKKERKKEIYEYVFEYFKTHPCVDCGESDPIVLEFDHRKNKTASVSNLIQEKHPVDIIAKEIQKCDVRCANCHRRKTAKDFGWYAVMRIKT